MDEPSNDLLSSFPNHHLSRFQYQQSLKIIFRLSNHAFLRSTHSCASNITCRCNRTRCCRQLSRCKTIPSYLDLLHDVDSIQYRFPREHVIGANCKTASGSLHYTEYDINLCTNNNRGKIFVSVLSTHHRLPN